MHALSYVLPIKAAEPPAPEFFDYVNRLSASVELILVDGSAPPVYRVIDERCAPTVRHLPPDEAFQSLRNGKVRGVLTGLRMASQDLVVIADDDVRHTTATLEQVCRGLARADVVRPQNYFAPLPWHARLDTARMLINRVTGGDWPGTLGLRRAALEPGRGYDGNVLFENLELVRTVQATGGVAEWRPDLLVARRPPTTSHFWNQRIRQAYDEFARPPRLIAALALLPAMSALLLARRWRAATALFVAVPMLAAEAGRRHAGARHAFPASSALWAPAWVLERGICAWLAVGARLLLGGMPYAGRVLKVAAHSEECLASRSEHERKRQRPGRLLPCAGGGHDDGPITDDVREN